MRKKIRVGLQAIIALAVIYTTEMAILGSICRFLSEAPYRVLAPVVVIVVMLVAWTTIFLDMKKKSW